MERRVLEEHDVGTLFALKSVVIHDLSAYVCPKDGELLLVGGVVDALHRQVLRVMLTENYELAGYEVRFLRKALGLTQQRLADLVGVDRVTVARWETAALEESLGGMTSIALRTVLSSVEGASSMRVPASAYREPPRPHPLRLELDAPMQAVG